jgi:hypothetical protein
MRDRCINRDRPESEECEVGAKAHAFHERPRNECGGDDGESPLEGHEQHVWDRAGRFQVDPTQQRVRKTPDQRPPGGKGERVAEQRPREPYDRYRAETHHQRVENVLGANEPPVEKP